MNDDQLRALAATRPGYATYPDSRPGSPTWWRRPLPDGTTGRPITGRDVARFAEQHLGVTVTPWQVRVLDEVYEQDLAVLKARFRAELRARPPAILPADGIRIELRKPEPRWRRWLARWKASR